MTTEINTSNYRKFQTTNPIVRTMFRNFFDAVRELVEVAAPSSLLDAGCGEGMTLSQLDTCLPSSITAFDINPDCVAYTSRSFPEAVVTVENIYDLPYPPDSFDVVLCLEVLEHLDNPKLAIQNLARIAKKRLILSVPHEPWFRLGSLCRGKHLSSLGNHPEHINHWNPSSFEAFLREEFDNVNIGGSFPWVIAEVCVN